MSNKFKVLWFCGVINKQIEDYLKPTQVIGERAQWITNMISLFENNDDIELHIVFKHEWIKGYKHFIFKKIHYHCFNPYIAYHWPKYFKNFDLFTDYYFLKKRFARIVAKIKPNIIHLHGAETIYSSAIFQFLHQYPVFITIQGFLYKSRVKGKIVNKQIKYERKIIENFKHFGYRTKTMGKTILEINSKAILHWQDYPTKIFKPINQGKKYDIVFFARMSKDKGIADLLKALRIIKLVKKNISLCVIGGKKAYDIIKLEKSLALNENIHWAGFLPTLSDVHKLASTAKITVLPTYHDIISGTIIESLFLKIPVVAYDTGSIHELNEKYKVVSLVKKGDIEGLADSILRLLNDEELMKTQKENGYKRVFEMFVHDNSKILKQLLNIYRNVIENFNASSK